MTSTRLGLLLVFLAAAGSRSEVIRFDLNGANAGSGELTWMRWNVVDIISAVDFLSLSR